MWFKPILKPRDGNERTSISLCNQSLYIPQSHLRGFLRFPSHMLRGYPPNTSGVVRFMQLPDHPKESNIIESKTYYYYLSALYSIHWNPPPLPDFTPFWVPPCSPRSQGWRRPNQRIHRCYSACLMYRHQWDLRHDCIVPICEVPANEKKKHEISF